MPPSGPTTELGRDRAGNLALGLGRVAPWSAFIDADERVPELMWPRSVETYDVMRTDSQVQALLDGTFLPIRRYRWMVDPNGARPEVVETIAEDLGLPVAGSDSGPRGRTRDRFSWPKHLRHVLLALVFGHMYFEQVGRIDDSNLWRMRKLAPRMPRTIGQIKVADDGGLVAIKQNIGFDPPEIPVDRLVAYIWDQEGGNWVGRSMLRQLYKHWLIKDRLMRVDAMKHQRNGMGVPWFEAPPNATPEEIAILEDLASRWKAGEASGGAGPAGAKLTLKGVDGSIPDTVESMRYHDEQMARRFLMMFAQLGQTKTGARSLGESFVDFFFLGLETIGEWVCDVTNEHVIEDMVDWNWGEDELVPKITFEVNDDPSLSVEDLKLLIDSGALVVDPELEGWIRQRYRIPKRAAGADAKPQEPVPAPGNPAPPVTAQRGTQGRAVRRVLAAAGDYPEEWLPQNGRRQPYTQEVRAQVNFAEVEAKITASTERLLTNWRPIKETQIDELVAQIADAEEDLAKLSTIAATPIGSDVIEKEMLVAMEDGVATALAEASRQGKSIAKPSLDNLKASVAARATAVDEVLARSLSEVAARQAIARTGGALTPSEVAGEVRAHLQGLSDTYLNDQFNGSLNQAMNSGRREVMKVGEATRIYASEMLDQNACDTCVNIDGMEYFSPGEAETDYPAGGYKDCLGGLRCRGTLVAVYGETEPEAE